MSAVAHAVGGAPAGARRRAPAVAGDLEIAGLTPLSSVDWPGRLSATVFCQGCPWDCGYCHNPALIPTRSPGVVAWHEVLTLLQRRHGLLDAVVFSGGEATRQAALLPAVADVRRLGFAVGLHTGGAYPTRLASLLDDVDWVGLDIKALPGRYSDVVRRGGAGERAWRSLELLLASKVDHEVRTTISATDPATHEAVTIARRLRDLGVTRFALQVARTQGTRAAHRDARGLVDEAAWQRQVVDVLAGIEEVGFPHLEIRRE